MTKLKKLKENEDFKKIHLVNEPKIDKNDIFLEIISPSIHQDENLNPKMNESKKNEEEIGNNSFKNLEDNDSKELKEQIVNSGSSDDKSTSINTKMELSFLSNNTETNPEKTNDININDEKVPNTQKKDLTQIFDIKEY